MHSLRSNSKNLIQNTAACALIAACVAGGQTASAATVVLTGDTIIYEYDDVTNAAALTLFGVPTIVGDVVRFLPPDFRAESIDGVATNSGSGGTDIVTANFIFDRVWAMDQSALQSIEIVEFGDYEVTNGDSAHLDLLLTASNNANFTEFDFDSASLDFVGDSGGAQTWITSASISPFDQFSTDPWDVAVTIQNTLTAITDANGESAWIQKKLSFVASSQIPVPAAAWLFGSGLLGLFAVKGKKRTS